MATVKFFVRAKIRELVPIYIRLSAGRGKDFVADTDLKVDPKTWSNKTQTIKQRIRSDADDIFIKDLSGLKEHIVNEVRSFTGQYSKDWLQGIIDGYHNIKAAGTETLNGFVAEFIKESESNDRKNKNGMNLSAGTISAWKNFQKNFNEFQGLYSDKRLKWCKKNNKTIRPKKLIDFDGVTIDFYNNFVRFLTDNGFKPSTIGRHIKDLKMFMLKALEAGLHSNRQFEHSAFKMLKSESYSVFLTLDEIDKIYNVDLSGSPKLDKSRDAFLALCETGLRISDYKKIPENIRTDANGTKLIYITQEKTGNPIVIPLSQRLEAIIKKYDGSLPKVYDQLINRNIKVVAKMAGINEVLTWESVKYGKKFQKKAFKWELVSCHTGRRSACTNMFLSGIAPINIMKISGHKSESMFMRYIKIGPEENARILSVHPYFANGLRAV
jgi:integrase